MKMKIIGQILCSLIVIAVAVVVAGAANSGLDIHCMPKRVDATAPQNSSSGSMTSSKEHWNYEVTVENKTFKPLTSIEVRYMIFYKTEELGSKAPATQQHQSGGMSIDALKPHEKKSFTTNPVELNKSHLTGRYYYSGGERIKAEDALSGIWIRVYQNGQQLAEYANPSALTKEQWQ
jgi:hypothetical protein